MDKTSPCYSKLVYVREPHQEPLWEISRIERMKNFLMMTRPF